LDVTLPDDATVTDLIEHLKAEYPILRAYTRFLSVAVNRAYVGWETMLHDGDEVACLPPVGGG
jgi:molybdopterin converting factor small subunit